MAKISKQQAAQERGWQIDSAMNTLNRYNELMKDQALMRDVHKKAKEQLNMVTAKLGGSFKKSPKAAVKKSIVKTKKKK